MLILEFVKQNEEHNYMYCSKRLEKKYKDIGV